MKGDLKQEKTSKHTTKLCMINGYTPIDGMGYDKLQNVLEKLGWGGKHS